MSQQCCVTGCFKNAGLKLELYTFPSRTLEFGRWLRWVHAVKQHRLQITNGTWEPNFNTKICNKHFVGNSISDYPESSSYVPTIFPKILKRVLRVSELQEQNHLSDKGHFEFIDVDIDNSKTLATRRRTPLEDHNYTLKTFCCEKVDLEQYSCDHCKFKSDINVHLKDHIKECHTLTQGLEPREKIVMKSYICGLCNFKTYSLLQWIKHAGKKCSKSKKCLFHCHHCSFKAKSELDFEDHLEHSHATVCKWLKCDLQTFRANIKTSFILPKGSLPGCGNIKKPSFTYCNYCRFRARSKAVVDFHVEFHHNMLPKAKIYACKMCTYRTERKTDLSLHIKSKHLQSTVWFKCNQCEFRTNVKDYLKRHAQLKHLTWDAPCSLF